MSQASLVKQISENVPFVPKFPVPKFPPIIRLRRAALLKKVRGMLLEPLVIQRFSRLRITLSVTLASRCVQFIAAAPSKV